MNLDDIIYLCLLLFSILFGYYYRSIKDKKLKQNVGAAVGFAVIFSVSKLHIIHTFVTVIINALIILYLDKRKIHIVSFIFSFGYLVFFRTTEYFGIPYPPGHTNMVQMVLTLKLVGLAFELNSSYLSKQKNLKDKTEDEQFEDETNSYDITFMDVVYYSFNYCGVLTGPYYRYRTFLDHLEKPYSQYDNYSEITFKKLSYVPVFSVLYLLSDKTWPLSYTTTPEFAERSFLYRYWYIWPTFFTFRMRIYTGLILSECVCTMAGLGCYPPFSEPKPGHGPTSNFKKLKELTKQEDLKSTEYNYETIHNINPYNADFCPTMREGIKSWNICVQYWLAVNIYKRFPMKQYRTFATMLVSAVWHGVYAGYYVCIGAVPFSLIVEDVWVKLLLKETKGWALTVGEYVMLFLKMQAFSYEAIAFGLLEVGKVMNYYNSVYHCMFFFYLTLYLIGRTLLILKYKKQKSS